MSLEDPKRSVSFCIDRGGTFTDVYAEWPGGSRVLKLLSEDPANYADAPTEGIRRVLEEVSGKSYPRGKPIDTSLIQSIRMGTTVATNALLERTGEKFALITTKGFKDLLFIGNQSRPNIFDLEVKTFDLLYSDVVEVDERVVLPAGRNASGREPRGEELMNAKPLDPENETALGLTGEKVEIRVPLDQEKVRADLQALRAQGISAIAVVLLHAAVYPTHELEIGKVAKELGFTQISLSHQVMPMVKMVPRGFTACADAYLTPHVMRYLDTFVNGFDERLRADVQLSFMQSDGGLTPIDRFTGHRAILSGPAGGVVGYARTSQNALWSPTDDAPPPVIGFDMGGTSTDVSRYSDGRFEHVHESTTAGITIQAPQLNIVTVAAGGGSRLFFQAGLFLVGPESAGANPGPVCYRKGGYLAVTDANVLLGRVVPELFPKIFGPTEDQPLDVEASRAAFEQLTDRVNNFEKDATNKTAEEVAFGFLKVANEAMCRPIRELTQMKGFDITTHVLACFGGAGGQHACAIARNLGISRVFVHRYSGILSAYGMGLADLVEDLQEPSAQVYSADRTAESSVQLETAFTRLAATATEKLVAQGIAPESVHVERYLNMRYLGTDCALMIPAAAANSWSFHETFEKQYAREFGFVIAKRELLVDDVRVRVLGKSNLGLRHESEAWSPEASGKPAQSAPTATQTRRLYCEHGWVESPLYQVGELKAQCRALSVPELAVEGPALVVDATSTIVVEPQCVALVQGTGDVKILLQGGSTGLGKATTRLDPIQLSIFSHRFMGIAEQMGRTLQRTSVSVNIKERLDFSCALFGPDGGLIANAPHIPVHLGAMQEAVRCQMAHWRADLNPGDVLMSNHPQLAGGSHLPDITVMTPVFHGGMVVFWVASRGHHADIGGIAPGSMPPMSKYLREEGAAVVAFKLVKAGEFQEAQVSSLLTTPPDSSPGNSGTRNLEDNLSDLKAQVAANNKGITLVNELIQQYGLDVVHAYMHHIIDNAEHAVRGMLKDFARNQRGLDSSGSAVTVRALDFMDNGSPIQLTVTIDRETGTATFDFEGTGPEVLGNLNAPPAVTYSAVIYCLRSLVGLDIPLNQGCLKPVSIKIPANSILFPSPEAGVVGGNVLTSQRVVDVVLQAFGACAASQGCMNNLTFGDSSFGYYETIAGGAGAGPTWHGRSGIHTHMTNTRITDPEVLERRYPVVLHQFSLREGSGGVGKFRGGEGVVRDLEFLRPITLSILSERRAFQPYGLAGGNPGARGLNLLVQQVVDPQTGKLDTRIKNLGGKNTCHLNKGDRVIVTTPGGGGYGSEGSA